MTSTDTDADLELSTTDRAALGAFRSLHPASSGMHKLNIAIASLFTLLLMGPALGFLIAALNKPGKGLGIGAAIFGGLGLLPLIGLGFLIRKLRWRLHLFEKGFVFTRGKNRMVLWDDVQSFYEQQDVVAGMRADRWLRFLLKDEQQFTIDSSYKDFAAFADAVRDGVTKAVLTQAAKVLPTGEAIAFGKLKLSKSGLEKEGESLTWAEVHSITIEPRVDGQVHANGVVVYKRGLQSSGVNEKCNGT